MKEGDEGLEFVSGRLYQIDREPRQRPLTLSKQSCNIKFHKLRTKQSLGCITCITSYLDERRMEFQKF